MINYQINDDRINDMFTNLYGSFIFSILTSILSTDTKHNKYTKHNKHTKQDGFIICSTYIIYKLCEYECEYGQTDINERYNYRN